MGLVDLINKLITEHGSADILRDHLELIREKVKVLEKENTELKAHKEATEKKIEALSSDLNALRRNEQKPKMKWGCLVFDEDNTLYCPSCFYKEGKKIPTSRKNIKYRYCSVCRADIPAG
ncbi:hypothetical protein D1BOALGB6SA_10304 [Olavius sp. associated proteobacterium Delta 1]|nr:hypothetical protein D1BOALGB6SA_10304 [Olavius sp. associated proteobacterium Delta 1]